MGRMRIKKRRSKAKKVSGKCEGFKKPLWVYVEGCDYVGKFTLCPNCPYRGECDLEFGLNEDFGAKEP